MRRDADVFPVDLDAAFGQSDEHRLADQAPGRRVHCASDLHMGVGVDLGLPPHDRYPALIRERQHVLPLDLVALYRPSLRGSVDAAIGDLIEPALELDADLDDIELILARDEEVVLHIFDRGLDFALLLGRTDGRGDWAETIESLLEAGAGPTAIYDRLRLDERFEGSLGAVKRLCLRVRKTKGIAAKDVAIPVETAAGEVAQVDFGYVGQLYDPDEGRMRKAWIFVMVLAFSRLMVVRVVFDQKIETWLRCHAEAFVEFGGVPKVVVPDNLKAAVIRASFAVDGGTVLNRSYREFARFFGFQVDPTPIRAPGETIWRIVQCPVGKSGDPGWVRCIRSRVGQMHPIRVWSLCPIHNTWRAETYGRNILTLAQVEAR